MAHQLETDANGKTRMFSVGELPWHKLGQNVTEAQTWSQASELSGLNTTLELQPIFLKGQNQVDGIPVIGPELDDRRAVVRIQDRKYIATVGTGYELIQNDACFQFMDALVGEGQAIYQTAGSLFDGRKIFVTCKLPDQAKVGPDKLDKYLLLTTSHDGTMSVRVKFTPIRVVCANTLAMAMTGSKSETEVRVRHSSNYQTKLEEARKVLGLTEEYYRQLDICCNKLLECKFSDGDMAEFVEELLPMPEEKESTRTQNIRDDVFHLFHNGIGHENVANTKWAAYNAVTQYIDHSRSTKVRKDKNPGDMHFQMVLLGSGAQMRQKAFDLLTV